MLSALDSTKLRYISQGHTFIVDQKQELRLATWGERQVRHFRWGLASRQDEAVAEQLIQQLAQAKGTANYKPTLEAIAKFVKVCKQTGSAFKRLENAVFAHKCLSQIPSLRLNELIEEDGKPTNQLFAFLKNNSLHYVIAKANPEHKETAILIDEETIYVRAKEGKSFLDTAEQIQLILDRLPAHHVDISFLTDLKELRENPQEEDAEQKIADILEKVELSHYQYQSLADLRTNEKGVLISQAYLADGIEDHEHARWKDLSTAFRETTEEPTYKFRVVTRLPLYALEKTWWGVISTVCRHILDFRAHGHSWAELAEPIYQGQDEEFSEKQNVYNVGYYFHPLDRHKRFESPDPMSYMPIPSNQLIVEEVEITKEQFEKAQVYMHEVQVLMSNPHRRLNDRPNNPNLSKEDVDKIQYLYKSTLKSTCTCFANTLKEVVTGEAVDRRGAFRRWMVPKQDFKKWDRIDTFIEKTFILQWLIRLPRFLGRMELPFWVKHQPKVKVKKIEVEE